MAKKPRMAGEKTREKLRRAGVPDEISERPELTMDEANDALYAQREVDFERAMGEPPGNDPSGLRYVQLESDADETDDLAEVVGESKYEKELRQLARRHRLKGRLAIAYACLVPEPKNPVDKNAVAVFIDGQQVGYLPREFAEEVQGQLVQLERGHSTRLFAPAHIYAGDHIGVVLQVSQWAMQDQIDELLTTLPTAPWSPPRRKLNMVEKGCGSIILITVALVAIVALGRWLVEFVKDFLP